ncbi:MAG: bifunctional adenosylcobinamide kinase/adenosylcobinamide-phosphate guanylyltransferase [Opitutus sp.]|nr:bifunctional adenosylcobinamide kinase/adenosylcobinamide-phosphate guanylyltransferase [Opitutus sp.]MCS6245881.1 bifunctional adenosylcobinamide kinase/adenosylcobinamide-phosphate guanylyltransferase [Opitutus sp.]MCS6273586.1 bifunctional adenosylcobinamide kinase/adenosylcobinamide-phosphate guanylyltransferase [Opitutus sp.]MCS6276040.1 bifunctional adenosylcobinamide kinase/adenosylcobinamide-phosphate guanylyltransferase [Opitutus sp.]MCS6301135.1 bifunctional adenosylcobinamide kina
MAHLTFLTGPVRSGKSRRAVELARSWGDDVVFVATYRPDPADAEMAERVRRHQAERPSWRTVLSPLPRKAAAADQACVDAGRVESLTDLLAALQPPPSGVVLDCLTLWLSDRLELTDAEILAEWDAVMAGLRELPFPSVVVGNEVGWSPVPDHPVLRRFRDLAGTLGQRTAAAADAAYLYVAGCAVTLKGGSA